jgi:uncharacterized protein (DUF2141 family)
MVNNNVTAYIHGHDHMYAYEELDGIAYIECPKPDDAGYDWEPYSYGYNEGLYPAAISIIQNSGYLRVHITPDDATFQYVRSYLPGDGTNGIIADTHTLLPNVATLSSTRLVTEAPNMVNPGENINMTAAVYSLPALTKNLTAGLPVTFNYVIYNLESSTSQSGSSVVNTNASGDAVFTLAAPDEKAVVLVDAVFFDNGNLLASSNMEIVSVLPILDAVLTATSSGANVTFHLEDQYGNPLNGQTLSFLTTAGSISTPSGVVTDASGDVTVVLNGATQAVVSGSFGGYINPQGWAYQPTMCRITVETESSGNIQTRLVTAAPNMVNPGENINMTAAVYSLPALTKNLTAGLPVTFNYVIYNLESSTSQSGSSVVNTNASGDAVFTLAAPDEKAVVLVDAVFFDNGNLLASSNMEIVSVLPILDAVLTATSSGANVTFHLEDQYGNPLNGQTLSFLTTAGSISTPSGVVTDASGDVTVVLNGATQAVVSGSFGGYINPQGWAYQPTMCRITSVY